MHKWMMQAALAVVGIVILSTALPARALVVAPPPPGPNRVANADVIVVGRVVGIEPKDIQALSGADIKTTYRIAVVNVSDVVKGGKETRSVRVAFIPPPENVNLNPKFIRQRPFGNVQLAVGQDGLFFLTKHHQENFYLTPNFYDFVANNPGGNFEKEVGEAKKAARLLENPMAGLKSGNADDRFTTAAMLIARHRNPRYSGGKTEAIPAEESKLILKAILEGKWNQPRVFGQQGPFELFQQLGLTAKDGWQPMNVQNVQDLHKAAQEWLQKNGDTYRIQRFIPGTAGNVGANPVPAPRRLPIERPAVIRD
jgi:hypothetical protein